MPLRQDQPTDGDFDRAQAVVQIWGPVLFLPFTTPDEALGSIALLAADPDIKEIRVVVLDLLDCPIVEPSQLAALRKILESIESWPAECLFTGLSPDSEATLTTLEKSHLILRRDFPEALPSAFQIAEAQRHSL
ncbi:MAG: hypothetical protein VCB25_06510 [Myxococcota bacterium]